MNDKLIDDFVEQLIQETLSNARSWSPLFPVEEGKNQPLFYALYETEFHHVRYKQSYSLPFGEGAVFLISEVSESGRDGTVFDGLQLYVQPSPKHELTLVVRDSVDLYRLSNAIADSLKLPEEAVAFIQDFLNS